MSESITPRTLVRRTFYEPGSEEVRRVAFDAVQPRGSIREGEHIDSDVIGFAEFPAYTKLSRHEDLGEFRETVEEKAEYVHWKPDLETSIDVVGVAEDHKIATDGGQSVDGTFQTVYREVNRFGLLLSVVGAGMMAYYRLPVVSAVFALCAIWFVWTLRRSQNTGTDRAGGADHVD